MSQARFGSNGDVGRIIKADYDPTLEAPKRFTRSDKQIAGAAGLGLAGAGYLRGAQQWPANAALQRQQASAYAAMAGTELKAHKAKIDSLKGAHRPFHWGFDRDRPGGPIKNWANRRRLSRQTPILERKYADAKHKITLANEAAKPQNIKARQLRMRGAGGAALTGAGYLAYRARKNRQLEQQAGMR